MTNRDGFVKFYKVGLVCGRALRSVSVNTYGVLVVVAKEFISYQSNVLNWTILSCLFVIFDFGCVIFRFFDEKVQCLCSACFFTCPKYLVIWILKRVLAYIYLIKINAEFRGRNVPFSALSTFPSSIGANR